MNPVYAFADMDMYEYLTEKHADLYSDKEEFNGKNALIAYYKTIQKKGKAYIHNPIEKWIIAVGKHEGIIEGRKWIAAQNELEKNKDKAFRRDRINEALLTGVIYCSCGSRMIPRITNRDTPSGERIFTYRCTLKERSRGTECSQKNANGNVLDKAVIEQIKGLNENREEFLDQVRKGKQLFSDHSRKNKNELASLKKQLADTEGKIASLIDSIPDFEDKSARAKISERISVLNEESEQLKVKINETEKSMISNADSGMEFSLLEQMLGSFAATIDEMNVGQKRIMVKSLIRKVIWDGKNAHVFLFGDPEGDMEFPDISGQYGKDIGPGLDGGSDGGSSGPDPPGNHCLLTGRLPDNGTLPKPAGSSTLYPPNQPPLAEEVESPSKSFLCEYSIFHAAAGIGTETRRLICLKRRHRFNQSDRSDGNQIFHAFFSAQILFCNICNQTHIPLNQYISCFHITLTQLIQIILFFRRIQRR